MLRFRLSRELTLEILFDRWAYLESRIPILDLLIERNEDSVIEAVLATEQSILMQEKAMLESVLKHG